MLLSETINFTSTGANNPRVAKNYDGRDDYDPYY